MTTLDVNERALRDAVATYPVVRSLRASADFPHGLRIVVNAYEPVAARPVRGRRSRRRSRATARCCAARRRSGLPVVGVKTSTAARARPGCRSAARDPPRRRRAGAAAQPRAARLRRDGAASRRRVENGPKLYFGGGERPHAKWLAAARVLAADSAQGATYVDVRIPERPVAGGFQPRQTQDSTSTLG